MKQGQLRTKGSGVRILPGAPIPKKRHRRVAFFTFGVRPRKQTALLSGGIRKASAMLGAQRRADVPGSAEVTESCRARQQFQKATVGWLFLFGFAPERANYFARVQDSKADGDAEGRRRRMWKRELVAQIVLSNAAGTKPPPRSLGRGRPNPAVCAGERRRSIRSTRRWTYFDFGTICKSRTTDLVLFLTA